MPKQQSKLYTIMICGWIGVGPNRDPHERRLTIMCTRKELDTIAKGWLLEYNYLYDYVSCIADEGEYVSASQWSIVYADCL